MENRVKGLSIPAELQVNGWSYVGFPDNDAINNPEAYVKVPIIHFEPPNFQPRRVILSTNYNYKGYFTVQDTPQAISPGLIPSIESLLQASLVSSRTSYSEDSPFARLYAAFSDFAKCYCKMTMALPLVRTPPKRNSSFLT